jgi:hypothetical protein
VETTKDEAVDLFCKIEYSGDSVVAEKEGDTNDRFKSAIGVVTTKSVAVDLFCKIEYSGDLLVLVVDELKITFFFNHCPNTFHCDSSIVQCL